MSTRSDIQNGSLIYTCNCGWIDTGHANGKAAGELWRQMLAESQIYTQGGIDGFKINFREHASKWGATVDENRDYFVKGGLSNVEKEQVALSVFMEVSNNFETKQGAGFVGFVGENIGSGSSFSEEDLPSNLVGFYDAVRGTRWRNLCKPMSVEVSLKVWDADGAVGKHKNTQFLPVEHKCDECTEKLNFPLAYQSISSIPKGTNHFDFDGSATPIFGSNFNSDFSWSPNFFGLLAIPKEVTLVVRADETQYDFARRALQYAAFLAKLSLLEQIDYANYFYPFSLNMRAMANFHLDWAQGDPNSKDGKSIKPTEFVDLKGKKFTFFLSQDQQKELKKRRSNLFSFP